MPVPYNTTTSGISATDGIGRRNSTVDAVAARSKGTAPMTRPSTMPASHGDGQPGGPGPQGVGERGPELGPLNLLAEADAIALVGGK